MGLSNGDTPNFGPFTAGLSKINNYIYIYSRSCINIYNLSSSYCGILNGLVLKGRFSHRNMLHSTVVIPLKWIRYTI